MKIDLHLHTTFSDGELSPEQVVKLAADRELMAIAVTDHDTMDGIAPAVRAAKKFPGLEVVPGIEINTFFGQQEIHILGYYIDYHNIEFKAKLSALQGQRAERILNIIEKLRGLGLNIDYCDILSKATGSSIGRPHIAHALIEKGYVGSVAEAFDTYLSFDKPAYVPRDKMTPLEAIDLIKTYEGIPVLAHPGLLDDPSVIETLIDHGLMGIEAYHIKHTPEQTAHYNRLAKGQDLLTTGGSDSHEALTIGAVDVSGDLLMALKAVKELSRI